MRLRQTLLDNFHFLNPKFTKLLTESTEFENKLKAQERGNARPTSINEMKKQFATKQKNSKIERKKVCLLFYVFFGSSPKL